MTNNYPTVQLAQYQPDIEYTPGAPLLKQILWHYVGAPALASNYLPFSNFKVFILRCFGATIGEGNRIKPGVKVKFPWRLTVGNHCWLGENLWIDNMAPVTIEDNVCLSQEVYLCTGNHDWHKPTFNLRLGGIEIKSSSWIAAKAVVGPGVTIGSGAILTLGSVATQSLMSWTIYTGNPAQPIKTRKMVC